MKGPIGLFLGHTLRVLYRAVWGALRVVLCDARCTRLAHDRHLRMWRGTLRVPEGTSGSSSGSRRNQGVLKSTHVGTKWPVGVLGIHRRRDQQAPPLQRSRSFGVCAAATPTLAPTTSTPTTVAPTTILPTTLTPSGAHSTGTLLHTRSTHSSSHRRRRHTHTHTHTQARQCTQTHANTYRDIHTSPKRAHMHTHTLGVLEWYSAGYSRGTRVVPRVGTRGTMGTRGVL
jgi:hypothetical protein